MEQNTFFRCAYNEKKCLVRPLSFMLPWHLKIYFCSFVQHDNTKIIKLFQCSSQHIFTLGYIRWKLSNMKFVDTVSISATAVVVASE